MGFLSLKLPPPPWDPQYSYYAIHLLSACVFTSIFKIRRKARHFCPDKIAFCCLLFPQSFYAFAGADLQGPRYSCACSFRPAFRKMAPTAPTCLQGCHEIRKSNDFPTQSVLPRIIEKIQHVLIHLKPAQLCTQEGYMKAWTIPTLRFSKWFFMIFLHFCRGVRKNTAGPT